MKGYEKYDKNTIRVSRQELNLGQKILYLQGILKWSNIIYYQFTTFEK